MSEDPKPTQLDDSMGQTLLRRPESQAVQPTPDVRPGAFTPPAKISRFTLEKLLGRGGMAAVFLAREDGTGRQVALKLMDPNLKGDPSFVERFMNEARSCASLRHPHVVEVYDYGDFEGWYFLACEFVDGGTVASLLEQMQALPAALAAELLTQLLSGLALAHERGVVHRDLKPENLLLTSGGILKIADFGIARSGDNAKLTKTGMLVGTAGYMSPEQASGKRVDQRSDLFSTGIILYEMLTGKNPFASDNPATSITRILTNSCPPLFEVKPTAPAELEAMLEKLLAYDADARFASAQEAFEAVLPYVSERRRTQPALVSECLKHPQDMKDLLDGQSAIALVNEVKGQVDGNALEMNVAAIKLFFALQLDGTNKEARVLLDYLGSKMKLNFGPPTNPKLIELESQLAQRPQDTVLLMQLAQLSKADGNLLKAAMFLRRYLRVKPNDSYVANQLGQLMGERGRGTSTQILPAPQGGSTRDLMAGVKTGGFKARPPTGTSATPHRTRSAEQPLAVQGIETYGVEAKDPRKATLVKLAVVAVVVLAVFFVWRKISKGVDGMVNGTQESADQLRARLDPGPPGAGLSGGPDGPGESPGPTEGAFKAKADLAVTKLFNEGVAALEANDFSRAIDRFDTLMQEFPKRPQAETARFLRGKALLGASRSREAITAFSEFLAKSPGSTDAPEALLRLGEAQALDGQAALANDDFTAFIDKHPSSPLVNEAFFRRGKARLAMGDAVSAKADFNVVKGRSGPADKWYREADAALAATP